MAGIKSLAKDTAVYGLSSIIGRFLNWGLVPLYAYTFPADEYGIVSFLYGFTAVALVILNYGMETGFFRYANKHEDPDKVYTTSLISLTFTSSIFIILLTLFLPGISAALKLPAHQDYVWMLGVIVALDAFTNMPFAYLRYKNKAWTFAGIKFLNIGVNIALNLFFILLCPRLEKSAPGLINWFYEPLGGSSYGIGWIFVANMVSTLVVLLALIPFYAKKRWRFDARLLNEMLHYSWPLLILGVAGIMSQNMGQLLIPYLFPDNEEAARTMVGIYGANIKIAIVMVMFTQAFRYAYEPFIFSQAKAGGESRKSAYCDAMKYFVIFGLLIFLGVMFFLPVLRYFIAPSYWSGLRVVPIMMMAELFFGVFFNLSLWYKLTDRTRWGMYFSLFGFVLMFGLNCILVPAIGIPDGYTGSAWAAFISYFAMMVVSWIVGRYYYPLPYAIGRMSLYTLLAAALYCIGMACDFENMMWLTYLLRIGLLAIYVLVVVVNEDVPIVSVRVRKTLHKIFPRRASAGKSSNPGRVAKGILCQLTPRVMTNHEAQMLLDGWQERPDADYIRDRVDFYCRKSCEEKADSQISGKVDIIPEGSGMNVWKTTAGYIRPDRFHSQYVYDLNPYLRAWPADTPLLFCDNDVTEAIPRPAITKARRLDLPGAENGILFNMDTRLLFHHPYDPIPFEKKIPKLLFRGQCAFKPRRLQLIKMWSDSPFCDIADTSTPEGKKKWMPIERQFAYRFILAPEGNDVSSALQWIMASGCVPVMTRPKVENWLMQSRLEPGKHYIEIADDFSDAEEKIQYYIDHPEEAKAIAGESRKWARQFFNEEREDIIKHLILRKYFKAD